MKKVKLVYPEPISIEKTSLLINEKNIAPEIAAIDLEMVKMKLQNSEEGEGWSSEQCESSEIEYKRFLHLCQKYGHGVVPNRIMDVFWHYHILDTRAYHKDCETVFGYYMHHFPYFGMRGKEDEKALENAWYLTKERYLNTFRESISRVEGEMKCWHDCQNRCWHACSN